MAGTQELVHRRDQSGARLRVGQPLRTGQIVDRDERVVTSQIANARAVELPGEPEPAVQADGDLKREPGLHPQMHEPELGMLEIEVVMETFAGPQLEVKPMRGVVTPHKVGQAWFDNVEKADQPFAHLVALSQRARKLLLAQRRRVQIAHRRRSRPANACAAARMRLLTAVA